MVPERLILLKFYAYDEEGNRTLCDAIVVPIPGGASLPVVTPGDPEGDHLECWAEVIE